MSVESVFILLIIAVIFIEVLLHLLLKEYKEMKEEREEKKRKERDAVYRFFANRKNRINSANEEFLNYGKESNGYFSNYQLNVWKKEYSRLYTEINNKDYEIAGLDPIIKESVKLFIHFYDNCVNLRERYNKYFIEKELVNYQDYFNKIEKYGLDLQQRVAVITDEDNNLVIAGAGSGKTTTIVGKVNYLIDRYNVPTDEILLISFTNKSASSLASRVNVNGIEARTFHRFGLDVLGEVDGVKPSVFDENQFDSIIRKIYNNEIKNSDYLKKFNSFFFDLLKIEKPQHEFEHQGSYFQYLKDQNFKPINDSNSLNDKKAFQREKVKSIEECKIANFLFINNIEYEYEKPYPFQTSTKKHKQYRPDFTINSEGITAYLEHFAISKDGKVPHFFADPQKNQTHEEATREYVDGMEWKRILHNKKNTLLIETYSYEMFDNVLFDNLEKRLNNIGIYLHPKSQEEIYEIIQKNGKDELDSIITLFKTFIALMKSNNYCIDDLIKKNNSIDDEYHKKRNSSFIEIIKPIFEKYESHLKERGEIDFSDMINKASSYITNGKYRRKFSYVIIDEFQDISIGRYRLIKAIKERNPSCKLFCVGDDWQSIYRFTGSDIALFKDFESYFGYTVKSNIETTYRFHNPLLSISSEFILKNPNQTKKELKSFDPSKSTELKIVYSEPKIIEDGDFSKMVFDDTEALKKIFDELLLIPNIHEKEIYILGRYSFDINRIKNKEYTFKIDLGSGKISYNKNRVDLDDPYNKYLALISSDPISTIDNISATYMTVHKAKGLEADIVIILNCNSGKYGFPSEMSDDPVLNLLLSDADQFENGEERRLFYVALTRAKERIYLITDTTNKSKFITELEVEDDDSPVRKCPKCITADLLYRQGVKDGKKWAFWGCSNYTYGCDYILWT